MKVETCCRTKEGRTSPWYTLEGAGPKPICDLLTYGWGEVVLRNPASGFERIYRIRQEDDSK